ncbi:lipopolysaccharide biosynthesis protein, partial [Vibrio splendidus]
RFYNKTGINKRDFKNKTITTYICLIFILFFLFFSLYGYSIKGVQITYYLFFLIAFQSLYEITLEIYRSSFNPKTYGYISLVKSITTVLLALCLLLFYRQDYEVPILSLLVGFIIPLIFFGWKTFSDIKFSLFNLDELKLMFFFGVPFTLTALVDFVINLSDRFIISRYLGYSDLGLYSLSYDITFQSLTLLMVVINLATYPHIVKSYEDHGINKATENISDTFKIVYTICCLILMLSFSFSNDISKLIFDGSSSELVSDIIRIISLASVCYFIRNFCFDVLFHLEKRTKFIFLNVLSGAIINVIINLLFIKDFGLVVAAYSTLISFFVCMIISVYYSRKIAIIDLSINKLFISLVYIIIVISVSNVIFSGLLIAKLLTITVFYLPVVCYINPLEVNKNLINGMRNENS